MSKPDQDKEMPLLDHLIELRSRLLWSFVGFLLAFMLCYYFAADIYAFLSEPLEKSLREYTDQPRMIYTALWEVFFTEIKVAFFGALCLSFPIIASQIWIFIAPGLYKNEKKAIFPFLLATPILFLMGASLVYYIIFPLAWEFFLSFQKLGQPDQLSIVLEAKVGEYLSLVMKLIFAFGLCFQLPVLLMLLTKVGLVSATSLAQKRRYAVVGIVAIAAVLTPPDVISQIGLAVPIILLYEISIFMARIVEKRKKENKNV